MNDIVIGISCVLGCVFGILISVYIALCFTSWVTDVIDNRKRRYKK